MKLKPKTVYGKFALTVIGTFTACLLIFLIIFKSSTFVAALKFIGGVLAPILYGFVIAYLLDPFMMCLERGILKLHELIFKKVGNKARAAIRIISSILIVIIMLFIVYAVISKILPSLIESIQGIVQNVPVYISQLNNMLSDLVGNNDTVNNLLGASASTTSNYVDSIWKWIQSNYTPLDTMVSSITGQVVSLLSFLWNVVLGIIISIYVLIYKARIKARIKRVIYAIFSITTANQIMHNLRFVDTKFGGFIIGKLIDSLIIGIICFVCMTIMKMPYPLLIAVVVGLTNVIPFFGPFMGAIPSAILIFFVSPLQCLYFIIFVLILQQFDGNLLGPKILGSSVGVSTILVVISILIGSGLLGVAGMILAVPVCALLAAIIQSHVIRQDIKKDIPSDLESYRALWEMDPVTHKPITERPVSAKPGLYDKLKNFGKKHQDENNPAREADWDLTAESIKKEMEKIEASAEAEKNWKKD